MAEFTPNYGLHQWQPADKFLRTDFNTDFSKLDTALKQAEQRAGKALDALEPVSYNVYNLMLQNQYEGHYTGYKKALLFDGFVDGSGVAQLSGGLAVDLDNRCLYLDAVGQTDVNHNYGNSVGAYIDSNLSAAWTATGNGTLTGLSLYLQGTATISILQGEQVLATDTRTGNGSSMTYNLNCAVVMGQEYQIKLTCSSRIIINRSSEPGDLFGFLLHITPSPSTQGGMVSVTRDPGTWERARAWVRHSGGTVSLSLGDTPMASGTKRTVENLEGDSCTETAFSLDRGGSAFSVRLNISTTSGQSVSIYDYGIVLL